MAGSITIEYSEIRKVKKVTLNWTSDAAGAVSGTNTKILTGRIVRVSFIPGTGGTVPTNGYTVVLNDAEGIDVLQGYGLAGFSDVNSSTVAPKIASNVVGQAGDVIIDEKLSLVVAGAGNAKTGKVCIYLE